MPNVNDHCQNEAESFDLAEENSSSSCDKIDNNMFKDIQEAIALNEQQFEAFTRPSVDELEKNETDREQNSHSAKLLIEYLKEANAPEDYQMAKIMQERMDSHRALCQECSSTTLDRMMKNKEKKIKLMQTELTNVSNEIKTVRKEIDEICGQLAVEEEISVKIRQRLQKRHCMMTNRKKSYFFDKELMKIAKALCRSKDLKKLTRDHRLLCNKKREAELDLEKITTEKFPDKMEEANKLLSDARKALILNTKADEYATKAKKLSEKIKNILEFAQKLLTVWMDSPTYSTMEQFLKPYLDEFNPFSTGDGEENPTYPFVGGKCSDASKKISEYKLSTKKEIEEYVERLTSALHQFEESYRDLI